MFCCEATNYIVKQLCFRISNCQMCTCVKYSLCQSVQLMSALKSGEVANVRMASIIQQRQRENSKIPVDRSGGGL